MMLGLGKGLRNELLGSPASKQGAPGYTNSHAIYLDGVDEAIRIGNGNDPVSVSLATTTTEGTISFWVYLDDLSSGTKYIMEKGSGADYFRVFYDTFTSRLNIVASKSGGIGAFQYYDDPISAATWYMFTITFEGIGTTPITSLYIDGSFLTPDFAFPSSATTIDPGVGFTTFGKSYNATSFSQEIVDEIAVWDNKLSASEITEIYTYHNLAADSGNYASSGDLLRWWKLNNDYTDSTGNGVDFRPVPSAPDAPSFVTDIPF